MDEKKFISLNDIENCPTFNHYEEFAELGKGANAVTFKAKHKIINQVVVIKVYAKFKRNAELMDQKHLAEIKKNSEFRLTKDQSVVFDAGTISIKNENYQYSIMNYLDGITLKQWLEKKRSLQKRLIEIEINAALGFLYCCYNLIENDYDEIIHGDINQGNVMFLMQNNYSAGSDGFLSYCTRYGDYLVPTVVEFIDYGTSKWEKTTSERGIRRDFKFIMDNTCKILSSYPINDFIDYNAIVNEEDDFRRCYRRNYLIVDLIRIILSIHFLDGLCSLNGFENNCQEWLHKLWYHEFKWDDEFEFNQFINLHYWFALKKPSMGGYIKEKVIIDYMNEKNKDSYQITFSEKFKYSKITFK